MPSLYRPSTDGLIVQNLISRMTSLVGGEILEFQEQQVIQHHPRDDQLHDALVAILTACVTEVVMSYKVRYCRRWRVVGVQVCVSCIQQMSK